MLTIIGQEAMEKLHAKAKRVLDALPAWRLRVLAGCLENRDLFPVRLASRLPGEVHEGVLLKVPMLYILSDKTYGRYKWH